MPVDYKLRKVVIEGFRGISYVELELHDGQPSIIIGSNNACKSTVLHAVALALGGGGYHQWQPSDMDFYCGADGRHVGNFVVKVLFEAQEETGYPAVKGVSQPTLIHGVQVKGTRTKDGRMRHSRTLLDKEGQSVTFSTRTPLAKADKERFADHDVGYRLVNARLDDIYEHTPEVWLFTPQNIEAFLYVYKNGPIAKLSRHLAERFMADKWEFVAGDGKKRPMPKTLENAYGFFREVIEAFPFWKNDMRPRLEKVFARYVGKHVGMDLKPDIQTLEEWLAQQLVVSFASDPDGPPTPLRSMGDGWQSAIRLAALEALSEYEDLVRERVVLLLEEPETHLHPHLRRKIRKVLSSLAKKGWTVIYTTHSPELVSFAEEQAITRLVRSKGVLQSRCVKTEAIESSAKLQSKLDDNGAHDFLFGAEVIFCEGKDDSFAIRYAFEKCDIDYDARGTSVTQCGSVTAIAAFASIAKALGIRWCAVTDEDRQPDGTIKPQTEKSRAAIETHRTSTDIQIQWKGSLEDCLGITSGKASADIAMSKLDQSDWQSAYPDFAAAVKAVANWVNPP